MAELEDELEFDSEYDNDLCNAEPPEGLIAFSTEMGLDVTVHVCDFQKGHSGPHGCPMCGYTWDYPVPTPLTPMFEVVIEEAP